MLVIFSIVSWAIILYKLLDVQPDSIADLALPRRLPPQQQVLGSAGVSASR